MFWKRGSYTQSKSIRTQLTLFYGFSAFLLLMGLGFILYLGTTHILYKADYEFLSDEVDTIQYILENPSLDMAVLNQAVTVTPKQENKSLYRYFIRVLDPNEQTIIETPGMSAIFPEDRLSSEKLQLLNKRRYLWYSTNNNQYLLIQAPIWLDNFKKPGSIVVILDISYQHNVISDRKALVALVFLGGMFALLLGFLASHRGVKKLNELTRSVEKITASSLHHRVNPKEYPVELRELASAFNQMLEGIECSVTRLKQFTGDLAHELRTPVTNLTGETEMALTYSTTPSEFKEVLSSNLEELNRMSLLIENILFLARADNPKIAVKKKAQALEKNISQLIEYYQAMADEKNINLTLSGSGVATIHTFMFNRMIGNLISNALKYTQENGEVSITIHQEKKYTDITISDNGMGIEPEHIPNLFNRFYRVDSARTKSTGGIGLGLAIVKSIVDLHHGKIEIQSKLNEGTKILVRLPV